MVVCGDDALAHRLAAELTEVYGERVTLVVPSAREPQRPLVPPPLRGLNRATALLGRVSAAVSRTAVLPPVEGGEGNGQQANGETGPQGNGARRPPAGQLRVLVAPEADDEALTAAGVCEAGALALVYDDDEANIHAALRARRLNPCLRLVIRLYNRKLGQYLEDLLDQAAAVATPDEGQGAAVDASTTVLSDADTVAPGLVATAVAGTSKVIEADGLLLRAVDRTPPAPDRVADPGLATLALLSATVNDPAGAEGSAVSGDGPTLLPTDELAATAAGCQAVVLETVTYRGRPLRGGGLGSAGIPLRQLFSRRLRWSIAGVVATVLLLTVTSFLTTDITPVHAAYLALLDLFAINEPAVEEPVARKLIQLLSGLLGLLLMPVMVAAVLEGLGTFRNGTALRRPPRGLSGHVVLLGLGKVGTRVLARLHEMGIPVVCVEADPEARGVALARRLRVPTVLGDVTQEGVLEAAKIGRARILLALTSADSTNLEAALYARSLKPRLRVTLRLFDDRFATAVYRTLRTAHPHALTRSRSVSFLAAPAFAGAMMGRQILGAIPVERRVLLFARVEVRGHADLEGRTIGEVFRAGRVRVLAVACEQPAAAPASRTDRGERTERGERTDRAEAREPAPARLAKDLGPDYVLRPQDRVLVAATRQGLGDLLGRRSRAAADAPAPQQVPERWD